MYNESTKTSARHLRSVIQQIYSWEGHTMKKFNFRRCAAAVAAFAVMASAMPSVPFAAEAAGNIIKNSTFDNGTAEWGTYKESGGACSLSTDNGRLALTVSNVGQVNYAVQVFYDIIPLYQNGVYRLKYDISCTTNRFIECMIQQNGGTYQAYTWKGLNLTSTPQTIDYEFTMEQETDIMSKLVFNCGIQEKYEGALPEHVIYIDNVSLELVDDSKVDYSATKGYEAPILANQVGYRPDAEKTVVIRGAKSDTFSVVNDATKEVAYTGTLGAEVNNTSAGETNRTGDFTALTAPGTYHIESSGLDNSYSFVIGDNVYDNLIDETVRMLYLQRCGTAVTDSKFSHPACHNTMATVYGTNEKIDVSGGWHDAGDYGRYVVPAAKSVADLLFAYGEAPSIYSDNIGIPESGNGTPDILDEVRYELEWMLKMQRNDGGVYHKVSCATFPGYVMPQEETKELIVTPVSTTATADFCASMAMAGEFYKDVDPAFAQKCLAAAEKAWSFLEANPQFMYTNPEDIVTGDYGDFAKSDKDERYWAAAQLYRTTKDQKYISAAESIGVKTGLDWSTVGDYGNIAIVTMDGIDKESDIYKKASASLTSQAGTILNNVKSSPYGSSVKKYDWGSNMTIANMGIILGYAYKLTGNSEYLDAANRQTDYLLGANPLGTCFVTGFGTVSPQNPHHRPSMAVGSAMPGMLVGGVNSSLEDSAAKAYCQDSPAAKCWVDNSESYSTNEITIYWNSPLTYLLTLTADNSEDTPDIPDIPDIPDDEITWGDANLDGNVTVADAVAILQYLGNKDKYELKPQGKINGDVYMNGDGITAKDALSIQKLDAHLIDSLPESYLNGEPQTTTPPATTTTAAPTTTTPTTTTTAPPSGIQDFGTPMNANATAVADFRLGSTPLFFASDGWSNGSCFNCYWYKENTSFKDGVLNLTIDKDTKSSYPYSAGEYRTADHYGYGYYETSMQAIKNNGVVSSFFTYTGESEQNPWDEIDIEILGKDTTKVQLNYYTNGVGNHEYMYDLGFDASEGFHTYGFDWQPDHITWYVDGKAVYTAYSNIPSTPGRIMMNVWPGITVDEWLAPFDGTTPLTARYQWVTYNKQ